MSPSALPSACFWPAEDLGRVFLGGLVELALRGARLGDRPARAPALPAACPCPRPAAFCLLSAASLSSETLLGRHGVRHGRLGVHRRRAGGGRLWRQLLALCRRRWAGVALHRAVVVLDLLGLALDGRVELVAGVQRFALGLGLHSASSSGGRFLRMTSRMRSQSLTISGLGAAWTCAMSALPAPWPAPRRRVRSTASGGAAPGPRRRAARPGRPPCRPRAPGRRRSRRRVAGEGRSAAPACAA